MSKSLWCALALLVIPGPLLAQSHLGHLETDGLPPYLRDRGTGIATSMFATYLQPGQVIVYPFFEYYRDEDFEYKPAELGHGVDEDFRGKYRAKEYLIFVGYGVTDRLALEIEAASIDARLEKSPDDPSTFPAVLEESGVGDVEGQLRWRWRPESERRAEIFSYFEVVGPTQDEGSLIGTSDWEFKLGTGATRGFRWGTMTGRAAVEYDKAESKFDVGELAIEYVRRLSPSWRTYLGVEGTQDEIEGLVELQWHLAPGVFLKLNNGFGITSKATDWAPEVGIVFSFWTR